MLDRRVSEGQRCARYEPTLYAATRVVLPSSFALLLLLAPCSIHLVTIDQK